MDIDETVINNIEKTYTALFPESPFEYFFLDQSYYELYKKETQIVYILTLFASLAILIACLGLFGLMSIIAYNRTKEIGIRKTLGASIFQIIATITREFWALILIAIVIGIPISYYISTSWVKSYSQRIEIDGYIMIPAIIMIVVITILTLSHQAFRIAKSNPIQSLRS